jgi:hypothetical protein
MICVILTLPAHADDFALPPASEFGETSIETLGLRNAESESPQDSGPSEPVGSLGNYPLSREELGLVFDAAMAEKAVKFGFMERPNSSDVLGARDEIKAKGRLPEQAVWSAEPLKGLSLNLNEEAESGIRVDIDPYEEEVTLNWFVGF